MAGENIEILYFAPSDTGRSSIPYYAKSYVSALANAGVGVVPMLDESAPERLDDETASIALTKGAVAASLNAREERENQVLHVEIGTRTVRELWASLQAGRLRRSAPLCVTFHDPPRLPPSVKAHPVSAGAGVIERLLTKVTTGVSHLGRQRIEESFLERATALFALSKRSGEVLAEAHPRHAHKIVQAPAFNLGPIAPEIAPNARRIGDTMVVTWLGFIDSEEGILEVLDALLLVHRRFPLGGRLKFRIRGTASDLALARGVVDRIHNRILSTGNLWLADFSPKPMSEKDVDNLLRETDILVLPYARGECDATSKTLMRSQTWAVAAIASDTGCMRELIDDGRDGILYPPGDVGALAAALKKLIVDQDARFALARALRERAVRERTPERLGERMTQIYGDVVRAHSQRRPLESAFRAGEDSGDA
jgi:glycosyltransferase involved in cell wall biosynthesis